MGLSDLLRRKSKGPTEHPSESGIFVVGVGGGGCNIVNRFSQLTDGKAKSIAVNTDKKSLTKTYAEKRLLIGSKYADEGAKGNMRLGKDCAMSSRSAISDSLQGAELVFLVCGLGGGTGTGASPVIADIANKQGAFIVSMITLPFEFEKKRRKHAFRNLKALRKSSDIVVLVDNQKLMQAAPEISAKQAFSAIDQLMCESVMGLISAIDQDALVSVGMSKLRRMADESGLATIMWGESLDPFVALSDALGNPLLPIAVDDVQCALLNVHGGRTMDESNVTAIYQGLVEAVGESKDSYCSADIEQGRNSFRVMVLSSIAEDSA